MRAAEKSKKGCLFYGCLTSVILGLVLFVVVPLALYFGVKVGVNRFIENYTDVNPLELPTASMEEAELRLLRQRVEQFRKAIQNQESAPALELTAEEINALIFHDKELGKLKGKAYLEIEENALKGQVSIPLSDLNLNSDTPRYINGSGAFKISTQNGKLSVIIQSLEIHGKTLPVQIQKMIQGKNLFENAQMDPETQKLIKRLKTFEVRDKKLILELNEESEAEIDETLDFEDVNAL